MTTDIYNCKICDKNFTSKYGLSAHNRVHTNYKQPSLIKCCSILTRKEISVNLLDSHEKIFLETTVLKKCQYCKATFRTKSNSTLEKVFCNSSCSASYNNSIRKRKTKTKIINTNNIIIPKTKVYLNTCAKTQKIFYSPTYRKYHPSIIDDKKIYYYNCKFRFSISEFPKWFDGKIIEDNGWYSTPGSKNGIKNLNGVSRDHMISISYAFDNSIDPWFISHPANCELMLHCDNNRKKFNSSITFNELKLRIINFSKTYPNYKHNL